MVIRLRPEVIDVAGFRRRAWEFDNGDHIYYIQQDANDSYHVLQQTSNGDWLRITEDAAQAVIAVFEQEQATNGA